MEKRVWEREWGEKESERRTKEGRRGEAELERFTL